MKPAGVIVSDAVSFHDSAAQIWEAYYKKKDSFAARLHVLSSLISQGNPGERWLDAGCGTGTLSRWLARERAFSVVAIDLSEQMLRNATKEGGVEYRKADVANTGFPAGSFDGVLSSSVLEYLPSVEEALREFQRLLKPGGTLVASVPNAALSVRIPLKTLYWLTWPLGRKRWYTFLNHSKHCYSKASFAEILRRSGFSPERILEFGDLGLPLIRAQMARPLIMALARRTDTSLVS